jgi:hypothetical protein
MTVNDTSFLFLIKISELIIDFINLGVVLKLVFHLLDDIAISPVSHG